MAERNENKGGNPSATDPNRGTQSGTPGPTTGSNRPGGDAARTTADKEDDTASDTEGRNLTGSNRPGGDAARTQADSERGKKQGNERHLTDRQDALRAKARVGNVEVEGDQDPAASDRSDVEGGKGNKGTQDGKNPQGNKGGNY
jgi:hypothetical protein